MKCGHLSSSKTHQSVSVEQEPGLVRLVGLDSKTQGLKVSACSIGNDKCCLLQFDFGGMAFYFTLERDHSQIKRNEMNCNT